VLNQLTDGVPVRANVLVDRVAGHLDEEAVRLLLAMLVRHELVVISA
jgi:hypothetical protein